MSQDVFRTGTLVQPQHRLADGQVEVLHRASMAILGDPGIQCLNDEAAGVLDGAGCAVTRHDGAWQIRFPEKTVLAALETCPSRVVLGARRPEDRLILESDVPRVYFGTGSETNIYLETDLARFVKADDPAVEVLHPVHTGRRGDLRRLCASARLCNALENVDFFIRNVNLQDEDITLENKDANVFFASLLYMTRHVQAGLARLESLEAVCRMAEIVAGGPEAFRENPVISFITCLVKSPLQMVDDTTAKLMAIARRGVPVVISSSPQGGSTAPIREEGMVGQINAEILAGVTLAQAVRPGTPVLYGAVPVRARLDTLHDLYGAPEFVHYNVDCVQMARRYGIPCYSTAGVGDTRVPGLQATVEKLYPYLAVAASGAQYVHYAFGLLDKTNVFSPLQAVLDDAAVGVARRVLRPPVVDEGSAREAVAEVRKVMQSPTRLFARHIRKAMRRGLVSPPYPFEASDGGDKVLEKALERLEEIEDGPGDRLDRKTEESIRSEVDGILPPDRFAS